MKKEKLKEIDMLPKIKNTYFLTPELAPLFAARDDDLLQVLGILTRVADGHGYESDSGAQGHRGYNEEIMFVWLGACVDIPYKVHRLLGTLGPKLYFFRLPRIEETEDYYYKTRNESFLEKKQKIRTALLEYLAYFEMNQEIIMEEEDGLAKISLDPGRDEELAHRIIIRLAKLLAHLRALVPTWETKDSQGSEYAYTLAKIEDPTRAITQLTNLARGHALSKGRKYITIDDIPMVIHTALSTATMERVRILDLLIENKGSLTTSQIIGFLNTTRPTALRTMTELKATGLVTMVYDQTEYNPPREIRLKPEFDWFLSDQFSELRDGCKEKIPPRTAPLILFDYMINKKLIFYRENALHHNDKQVIQNSNTNSDCVRGGEFSLHQSKLIEESNNQLSQKRPPSSIDAAIYDMTAKSEMSASDQLTTEETNLRSAGMISYSCDYCRIIHDINNCIKSSKKYNKTSFDTLDLKERHVIMNHPGWSSYPGPPDLEKFEQELKKTRQKSVN